ncbi:65kDa B protein-domain-containing protein [Xylaria sp. FL1042]|nr:65kDa B protein-domain-containing protein [Xylaria sp. FL1042]
MSLSRDSQTRPLPAGQSTIGAALSSSKSEAKFSVSPQRVNNKQAIKDSSSPFRVDAATGAVTLTVPTVNPAGRDSGRDLTPNPELIYNSLAGNGPFGIGWTLALPGISRKTSQHVPTYTDQDVFVLAGGEDLVPTPANSKPLTRNGYEVQQYQSRRQLNSNNIRIERWTSCTDDTDQFWRTLSDTGLVTLYGRVSASRVYDPHSGQSKPRIFSWLPSATYDMKGNSAIYCYKEEDSANVDTALANEQHRTAQSRAAQRYLKRILYCNQSPFRNYDTWLMEKWEQNENDYLFEVLLDYGEHAALHPSVQEVSSWPTRADVLSTYHAGFEIRTYRLCRRVLLFHHFPDSITKAASLISSTDLQYRQSPSGSTLVSVTQNGHRILSGNEGIHSESLPPLKLEYSAARLIPGVPLSDDDLLLPITVDTSHLTAIPKGEDTHTQWVDLNGEGSPGILTRHSGGEWVYIRNESQGNVTSCRPTFGSPKVLQGIPNLLDDGESGFFTHLAADGTLQFVQMNPERGIHGYYPRISSTENWGNFVPFAQIPATDLSQTAVHWIDLVGNGRQDAVEFLVDDQNRLRWYPSLGFEGFASARFNEGPNVPEPQSSAFSVFLVDMTGDGLTDVVHVSNSAVSYWPNLGYGHFGARTHMDNSPIMDVNDRFTAQRVLLADVDGSGSADMIYLTPGGGANIYLNQSGNSWADPVFLAAVPELSGLSSIDIVDLLGQGVPCLCWTFPNPNGSGPPVLQYVEIMGQTTPNQLTNYCEGYTLETSIVYSPSTKFYLADEKAGRPWTTSLPFPVQCVHTINNTDHVAKTRSTSKYAYHDGFYDSVEREFRGFGHVDCWETEDLAVAPSLLKLQTPPRHSRTWYYTGSPLCETSYEKWTGNEVIQLGSSQVPIIPEDSIEFREARRAMKGLMLRTEVFGEDSSKVLEITQKNYTVLMEQGIVAPGENEPLVEPPHGCFRVLEREVLRKIYERDPVEECARIQHQLNLAANQNGQPTKTAIIHYGRRNVPSGFDKRTKFLQEQTMITYTEHDYTNPLDQPDALFSPQTQEIRSYRIRGVELPPESLLFSYDKLSARDSAFFRELPVLAFEQDPGPLLSSPKCKILTSQVRSYYRSSDMKTRLELGKIEPFSVLDQMYTLALTAGCLNQILVDENQSPLLSEFSAADGGYVDLDNNGNWWIPSSRARYCDPKKPWDSLNELNSARSHFYIPEYTVNTRGAVDYQQLDSFSLLRTKTVNSVGNESRYEYDYPFREPMKVTDANDNITEFAYDCFGTLVGTAVKGKKTESLGDSLDGFVTILSQNQLATFMNNPLETAPGLLGSAGSRYIYSRFGTSTDPVFEAEIKRSTHSSSAPVLGDFSVTIAYFDGRGNVTQQAVLHSTSPKLQWRLDGWQINSSNNNEVVLRFHPYLSDNHQYRGRTDQDHELPPAVHSIYDPLDRLVATLQPDHTWHTTTISAWEIVHKNAGDNLLVEDITNDSAVGSYIAAALSPESYLPTWYSKHMSDTASKNDKAAAQKSRIYNETPDVLYLDSEGHEILSITSDKSPVRQTSRAEPDAAGNVSVVFDTLDRLVSKSRFDLCQRRIFQETMDGRVDLALLDATGSEWLRWKRGEEGSRLRVKHDDAGRPLCVWLLQNEHPLKEKLIINHEYGEGQPNDKAHNLRGQLYKTLDQSGLSIYAAYDFKRNLVQYHTTFATDYKSVLDWSVAGDSISQMLEKERYTDHARYDAQSRPCETTAVDGSRISRIYNVSGQLDSIQVSRGGDPSSWTKYIASVTYTASGQRSSIIYGNGVSTAYSYDPLTLLEVRRTVWKQGRVSKSVFRDVQTTYDCLARRVYQEDRAQQEVYFRNNVIQPINDYTYDARGQLIIATGREKIDAESNTIEPYGPHYALQGDIPSDDQLCGYTDNISYDSVGNITRMQHVSSDAKVSGWTRSYEYDVGNRLSRTKVGRAEDHYSYNSRGCMTSMPGLVNMSWDHADRLRCTISQKLRSKYEENANTPETSWYIYNANGTRVRKVTEQVKVAGDKRPDRRLRETLYLRHLAGFEVSREISGQGQVKTEKKTLEVTLSLPSANSTPIALLEEILTGLSSPSTSRVLLLERYLLDQGLEVDDDGKLLSLEEYSPYGATTFRVTDKKRVQKTPSYRYSGYLRDTEETGFYFCQTRYYASWLGRWTSPDPLGIIDGLNTYRYVGNDPINFRDSRGTTGEHNSGGDEEDWEKVLSPKASRAARGPEEIPADSANLGIQRRELLGGKVHLWSSVVEFSRPLTNAELTAASRVAYNHMKESYGQLQRDLKTKKITNQKTNWTEPLHQEGMPTVMTAFAPTGIPNTVIFSSSAKAAMSRAMAKAYYEGNECHPNLQHLIAETKRANQKEGKSGSHRAGSCGEFGVIDLAFRTEPRLSSLEGTVVTYGRPIVGKPLSVMNPCGGGRDAMPPKWGCIQLLRQAGISPILRSASEESQTLPRITRRIPARY